MTAFGIFIAWLAIGTVAVGAWLAWEMWKDVHGGGK